MADKQPHPTELRLRTTSRVLEVAFDDGARFSLPYEYLRVFSPSAEVRGHGPGQEVLQTGKEYIAIKDVVPIGQYAVRLVFDDGHDSGLYSWRVLHELGTNMKTNWRDYLDRVKAAGYRRREVDATKTTPGAKTP